MHAINLFSSITPFIHKENLLPFIGRTYSYPLSPNGVPTSKRARKVAFSLHGITPLKSGNKVLGSAPKAPSLFLKYILELIYLSTFDLYRTITSTLAYYYPLLLLICGRLHNLFKLIYLLTLYI